MEVDHDLEARLACPVDCFVDVGCGAGDEGCIAVVVGPEANGETNDIEACRGDLLEIGESDPGIPVLLKDAWCLSWELLVESPFVDNAERLVERFEDGEGDESWRLSSGVRGNGMNTFDLWLEN